jgi:uncharacterized membrane protein YqiK
LAQIEKEKAVEVEKKNIQDVIRERVMVQRAVVEEEQRIKDTIEFATADRAKKVAVTEAEAMAQQAMVKQVKAAESAKQAATLAAEQIVIEAEAQRQAAEKETQAKKMLAEAATAEAAASGLAEAQVMQVKAEAIQKHGTAEAKVIELKFTADAEGIKQKAEAMKLFDGVGREHEEFKLRLNKDRDIELAQIKTQADIASSQAKVVGDALKSAKIDIVGGDAAFFDRIVSSVTLGKSVDKLVNNSQVLSEAQRTFFNGDGDPQYFRTQLEKFTGQFGLGSADVKNLSVAALILKLIGLADSDTIKSELTSLLENVRRANLADAPAATLNLAAKARKA